MSEKGIILAPFREFKEVYIETENDPILTHKTCDDTIVKTILGRITCMSENFGVQNSNSRPIFKIGV